MQTSIQQWGSSLALRIPRAIARQLNVKKGSRVRLPAENGRLVVIPVGSPEISLESLLAQVTPQNVYPETDWGKSKGREIHWVCPCRSTRRVAR
jgi:antitoxin MazE